MFIRTDEEAIKVNYFTSLVVFHGDLPNISILLQEHEGKLYIPSCPVKLDESSIQSAGKLLFDITGILARIGAGTNGFVDLVFSTLLDGPLNKIDEDRTVYTVYGCLLENKVKGNWVSLSDKRITSDMFLLLTEVGRKL